MWRLTIDLLASKKVALFLFFSLAIFLIPDTLQIVNSPLYKYFRFFLLTLFATNLFVCSITRFKTLRYHTLVIHLGCFLTIIGSLAGNLGYVTTINLYMGHSTSTAYRWDIEAETPLGFELLLKKINQEYYPVLVKIGVIDNDKQAALFQLKTGESFTYKGYQVTAGDLDLEEKSINLTIDKNDQFISHYRTKNSEEYESVSAECPLTFKLVAFKNPTVKKSWLTLKITDDNESTQGVSGVNQPLDWNGLRFFHTETGHDSFGKRYAGIQIVKDPGIPLVYLGFVTILLGCFLLLSGIRKKTSKLDIPC